MEFRKGDRVAYFDRNVNRWVKATVTGTGTHHGEPVIDCIIDEGQRKELPNWCDSPTGRSHWGYADQYRPLSE